MASQPSRTLQDVVFGIHFSPSPLLTVLDLASWVETFKEDGVDLQQQLPLPPFQLSPPRGQAAVLPSFIVGSVAQLPRLFLRGNEVNDYLVFQNDRVAFAWHRTEPVGEEANYPGYEALRDRWHGQLVRFNGWSIDRLGSQQTFRFLELSYQNAFPMAEPEANSLQVPPLFKSISFGKRPVEQFQLGWRELVPNVPGAYVDALATTGTVPPASQAFIFNFSAFAPLPADATEDAVFDTADAVHTHIRGMYADTILEGAL